MASGHHAVAPPEKATGAPDQAPTSSTKVVSIGAALVLAAILLFYSLKGIDWQQVARTAAHAKSAYLGVAIAIATASLFLRAMRWRVLLSARKPVDVRIAFSATAAGYLGNNFLPARSGELVRTAMIASGTGLDPAYVLATALSERAADAVVLVITAAIALISLPVRPGWTAAATKPFALIALIGVLAIAALPRLESTAAKVIHRLPIGKSIRLRIAAMMGHALQGMRTFHDPSRLLAFAGLTIVIWSMDALATVVGSAALGFSMPIRVAFLLLAALGLASALPSTPGYVGIFQFVAITVLTPFGFNRTDAVTFILFAQALNYVVIGFWGALGLMQYRRIRAVPQT
jgi:uncharacterized protein (TIRG00374 family)